MMYFSKLFSTCILWSCLPFSASADWKLDASCNKCASDIRTSMKTAFQNSRAVVAMQNNPYFLKAGSYIVSPDLIPDAVRRHALITQYYEQETKDDNSLLGVNDVIVYCDLSRYQDRTRKNSKGLDVLTHYDEESHVQWPEGPLWRGCSGPGYPPQVFAVTINHSQLNNGKPNQIQICPWFLNWALSQKFRDPSQVKPEWLVDVHPEAREALNNKRRTPMDLYTGFLLGKIFSHELTHTAKAGFSKDFPPTRLGWEYSVQLASVGNQNAENLAQLGATAMLIQSRDQMPNLAGNIVPLSLDG